MNKAFEDKNYYERLGVSRSATKKQITKAFRALSSKYHPDRGMYSEEGGELSKAHQEIFILITEAYNTLRDDKKRAAYDRKLGPGSLDDTHSRASSSYTQHNYDSNSWSDVHCSEEDRKAASDAMQKNFQARDSLFRDGGSITNSNIDLGNLTQRTSMLRSAVYSGANHDEEAQDLEEEYKYDADASGGFDYMAFIERIRRVLDIRNPVVQLVCGLLIGASICGIVAMVFM